MRRFLILLMFIVVSCGTTEITDVEANSFAAVATQGDYEDKIQISWIPLPIYKSYVVYRSTEEKGTYTPISTRIPNVTFDDVDVVEGKQYFYKVRGYLENAIPFFLSEPSMGFAGTGGGFFPPSEVVATKGASHTSILLEWKRAKDAVEYEIWRSDDNDFFAPIGKTKLLRYEDTSLESGKKYYYQISSFNELAQPSPNRSTTVEGATFGGDVLLNSVAGAFADKVELTWFKIPNVEQYMVFRSTQAGDIGVQIANVAAMDIVTDSYTYTDSTAKPSVLYYYTVVYRNELSIGTTQQIRSYLQVASAPPKVPNVVASQGSSVSDVKLEWDAVDGVTGYEVVRSTSVDGPWETLVTSFKKTIYIDTPPNDAYVFYYKVIALNPALGPDSDTVRGWANRPPSNIKASSGFGDKVLLTWDPVPNVQQFNISYSFTKDGTFIPAGSSPTPSFDHIFDIGNVTEQEIFYKIAVVSANGLSDPSEPARGFIQKITAPQNLKILNNKQATQSLDIQWDAVDGARHYTVYRATLRHKNADPARLTAADFKKITDVQNPFYQAPLAVLPLRRHIYRIVAIDRGFAEGVASQTELAWRVPVSIEEFMKDVDVTIIQAQRQVKNFGDNGSSGTINGRAHGQYVYLAGTSGSKSNWENYASFEVALNGAPKLTVSVSPIGAYMSGTVTVSGIYSGKITYHDLFGKPGGYTGGGSISAEYNHPTQGTLRGSWNHTEAGSLLISVVLDSERKPTTPQFEEGGG